MVQVPRFARWPKPVLAGCAGVVAAVAVASGLTQAASTTTPANTTTTQTQTTNTTTTNTTATTPRSAAGSTTRQITCRATPIATKPPGATAEGFGRTSCAAPFGKGVRHDIADLARTGDGAGTYTGSLKMYFNTGTLRGTYRTTFTVANKTISYSGTIRITSGTGAFAGVTGTGTSSGSSTDAVHSAIRERLSLKMPPKKG